MLFNSLEFALFFPAVVLLYFLLPHRVRWVMLLVASYYFYMSWRWKYGFLLLWATGINYLCGLAIGWSKDRGLRRFWVGVGVVGSLAPLFYYKYLGFAGGVANDVLALAGSGTQFEVWDIILPVGISFFTFQALSYTIDVYRGDVHVEYNPGRVALYVAFFPQLVAGPIERASHLLDQFRRRNVPDPERFASGFRMIIWGLFKKVVIADRLAGYVNSVYAEPGIHSRASLLLATYFFAFQIYCDFSGYSEIAIGSARILGYDLMENFRRPYFAASISEFWQRWHISLSTWFRDYLYIPLGGSRVRFGRWTFNIFAVFLLSGLWHGAGWAFLVWGACHGCYYLAERVIGGKASARAHGAQRLTVPRWLRVLFTFHLVLLAWVFFRATTLDQAFVILGRVLAGAGSGVYLGASQFKTALSAALIGLLIFVEALHGRTLRRPASEGRPGQVLPLFRNAWVVAQILIIALLGVSRQAFIYFQF